MESSKSKTNLFAACEPDMATKSGKTVVLNFSSNRNPTQAISILNSIAAEHFSRATSRIPNERPAASKSSSEFRLNLVAPSEFIHHCHQLSLQKFPNPSIGLCNFSFHFHFWKDLSAHLKKSKAKNVVEIFSNAWKKVGTPTGHHGLPSMNSIFIGHSVLETSSLKNKIG